VLSTKPELLSALRHTLAENKLNDMLSNMHEVIETDKKANGILHRMYLEGMRLRLINPTPGTSEFGDRSSYYVTNPITINQTVIRGGSVVFILNGMKLVGPTVGDDPHVFNPDRFITEQGASHPAAKVPLAAFSSLPRRCPAYNVTEYIAKTFVSYLAMKFDLKLHARPNEWQTSKIRLEFTSREEEQKEVKEVGEARSVSIRMK
jgi:cytochrome P450